ncbi:hypothetical protein OG887_01655 [Streptomyces sp. NBC_00053]|uniref:hypothetical protein n=1 Tax=unclassified Streptomyces TaxID=2593676 RepID=UPI0022501403|nr:MULTISPECIES: hypothetical protein [unclassified Streptomyces]MCX5098289.1 hypothetical protein [Streptomyces sp. NBC_00439]
MRTRGDDSGTGGPAGTSAAPRRSGLPSAPSTPGELGPGLGGLGVRIGVVFQPGG